jgi:hypothetical protein
MCKPSRSYAASARTADAVGVLVAAVIALAIVGTVGPVVLAICRVVIDIAKLAAIGIGTGVMLAAAVWITIQLLRATAASRPARRIYLTARQEATRITRGVSEQNCITCGDTGRIIRAIGNDRPIQVRACPDCQPARLSG